MIKITKQLLALVFFTIAFASCKKDADPQPSDVFIGKYVGKQYWKGDVIGEDSASISFSLAKTNAAGLALVTTYNSHFYTVKNGGIEEDSGQTFHYQ